MTTRALASRFHRVLLAVGTLAVACSSDNSRDGAQGAGTRADGSPAGSRAAGSGMSSNDMSGAGAPLDPASSGDSSMATGSMEGDPIDAPLDPAMPPAPDSAPTDVAVEQEPPLPAAPARCEELAGLPGLADNPAVKSATSQLAGGGGGAPAFCQVDILFGTSAEQNINIRVGLPLNELDGGTGGVRGAWNGRTHGIGGGGCSGSLNVTAPVAQGYVGSGTDTGHSGGDCEAALNEDGTFNLTFLQDFIRNAIKQQVLFSKAVATTYYAMRPAYNYWNGCSTGGRQGYLLAQELPAELDGVLANAPAIYWTRFQIAQMWGQIAMKDLVGGPIAAAKLNQATASAIAACDALDSVVDGLLDDPRRCEFSATANVCGAPAAPAANCLTAEEARAIDLIWDGPRNAAGDKVWFGLDRGSSLTGLNGAAPFALGTTTFHWAERDRDFDWTQVTLETYAQIAQDGSQNVADITDTFGDLDDFEAAGGKLLTFVGANDPLIYPRGVINYYRATAARQSPNQVPDFAALSSFYRLFRAPGVGHCGGGDGPQPQNLFEALVNWVENGVAPEQILASGGAGARSRPLCPYPQTAVYDGSGDPDRAESFSCGGNLEEASIVCTDALVAYKDEVDGSLDFAASGLDAAACGSVVP